MLIDIDTKMLFEFEKDIEEIIDRFVIKDESIQETASFMFKAKFRALIISGCQRESIRRSGSYIDFLKQKEGESE